MSFMTLKRALVACATVLATVAFAKPASADVVIDFGSSTQGGLMATLTNGNVVGINVVIDTLNVIIDGVTTVNGANVTGSCGGHGCLNFNTLTNTISIEGFGLTLLTGSFAPGPGLPTGWQFQQFGPAGIFTGTGPDRKDPSFLRFLGIDPGTQFAFFGFSIAANITNSEFCQGIINQSQGVVNGCYNPTSTDIVNTAVPEPGSMLLLGTGLFGLGGALRRRFAR